MVSLDYFRPQQEEVVTAYRNCCWPVFDFIDPSMSDRTVDLLTVVSYIYALFLLDWLIL